MCKCTEWKIFKLPLVHQSTIQEVVPKAFNTHSKNLLVSSLGEFKEAYLVLLFNFVWSLCVVVLNVLSFPCQVNNYDNAYTLGWEGQNQILALWGILHQGYEDQCSEWDKLDFYCKSSTHYTAFSR